MQIVKFIRHYKLEYPFNSKENLTQEQYVALSKGEIDPPINSDITDYCKSNLDKKDYTNVTQIFASPTKRTRETAQALKEIFDIKPNIEIINALTECVWNPQLPGERIDRFIKGTELSNLEDTWKRIEILNKFLIGLKNQNILCITHSFFMQILYLYYFCRFKSYKDIKYEDIKGSYHGDYLRGFDVQLR